MSIIIIDDDPNTRLLLERYLETEGYGGIVSFENSESFFDKYEDQDFQENVELILMDLMLPGMNGLQAVKKLKKNSFYKDVPVLAITARRDPETIKNSFDSGCIDYISKPLEKIELLARVNSALELKRTLDRLKQKNKQLEKTKDKLTELSFEDSLTGLANKRKFNEKLNQEWERLARKNLYLSLVMIDIDNFKAYNDTYGHEAGDKVLKKVGRKISEAGRRPADCAARYGGEEFILVLPDTDCRGAKNIAEKLRKEVENIEIENKNSSNSDIVTISLGVASTIPNQDNQKRDLVKEADNALYKAKSRGRNMVQTANLNN